MARYQLEYILHPPSEDTGWMHMAEVPVLPGCRAWADTSGETVEILQSVAEAFIASYRAHGEALPDGVLMAECSGLSPWHTGEVVYDPTAGPTINKEHILIAA